VWLFDADTAEHAVTQFRVPTNFAGNATVDIWYYAVTGGSSVIKWGARIAASSDGQALLGQAYADNSTGGFTPGTSGVLDLASIAISSADSMSASDFITLEIYRAAADTTDALGGDAAMIGAAFRWDG